MVRAADDVAAEVPREGAHHALVRLARLDRRPVLRQKDDVLGAAVRAERLEKAGDRLEVTVVRGEPELGLDDSELHQLRSTKRQPSGISAEKPSASGSSSAS